MTRRSPISIDLNDIEHFVFGQDSTDILATHMKDLEMLTNQNVNTEIKQIYIISDNFKIL